jgi:hypothetical protein
MATTFMNLNLPTPTVTLGPEWANQLNAALEVIDSHDHTSDKGQRVPTAGLNINEDLDFNSNKALSLVSTQFTEQASPLSGATNAGSLYVSSGDLYYTNTSGVAIQLTTGGSIITTPSSASTFETVAVNADLSIAPSSTFVYLIVDTTLSRTIDLPAASSVAAGRIYIIKDKDGQALDNPITVNAQGGDTIDNEVTQQLNSNCGSWMIIGDGINSWYIS